MEDDDEDYIFCGTPLPELDDDVVIRKRANQDLTVRDDKGRQRFHGAFTGGFSAGYFNTVGTKEGWEPASFVSSRTNKASSSFQQKTEDFMDEEDFGQFGIAPKRIHTTTNFRDPQTSSVRKRGHVADDVVIPGEAPLKDLIKPVTDSIGIRILKKMGWRHGQGIGPRMRKKSEEVKVIGCSLGPIAAEIGDDLVYNEMTFAPDDTPDVPYIPKDDYHGIGYSGLSTQSVLSIPLDDAFSLSKTKSYLAKDKRKLTIRGQAFGVGAFEDDDEDIYTKDDMSQYDFSEFVGNKSDTVGAKSTGAKDKYSSIIEVLEGFTLSTQPPSTKKYFSPPELPAKFKPRRRSRFQTKITTPENAVVKPKLGHIVRSIMLGENSGTKIEKSPTMSAKPRRSRFDVGPSETQTQDSSYSSISSGRFKPFSRDPEKQNRYEEFIKGGCNKDHLISMQPPSMTEWERHQEIDEFAKASVLYQPLSRALESRFESTSHLGVELTLPLTKIQEKEPEPAVPSKAPKNDQTKRETFEWHPVSLLCKRFNVPNPYPDSKDEGVPNSEKKKKFSLFDNLFAEKDIGNSTSSSSLDNVSVINTTGLHEKSQEIKETTILSSSPDTSHMSESLSENVLQPSPTKQEIPKGTKPPMDLFKEIFQNSSSEDSSSDEEKNEQKQDSAELQSATLSQKDSEAVQTPSLSVQVSSESENVPSITTNVETSGSSRKGFGVFANIDLDALNKRPPSSSKPPCAISPENQLKDCSSKEKLKSVEPMQSEKQNLDDVPKPNVENMFYGPEPPPPGFVPPVIKSAYSKAHKHSKHKHKHKEKKKKKHKKKHSRKDSEESSIDSDEDIPTSRILEKLKSLKDLRTPTKKQRK